VVLAPGHFHAGLVIKSPTEEVHPRVYVYSEVNSDLTAFVEQVAEFNHREVDPCDWHLDIRAGSDFFSRFVRELPGSLVVIAGQNGPKIERILSSVQQSAAVLADKPWIIHPDQFDQLVEVHRQCELREVVAQDLMTERQEPTIQLLRDVIKDRELFGSFLPGSPQNPGLKLDSVHYLKKMVAGMPVRRPAWWFDADLAGTGLADVGTHLVDLAIWLLFPDRALDYRSDVQVHEASIWPTPLTSEQFTELTGLAEVPARLRNRWGSGDLLLYQGNGTSTFSLKNFCVRTTVTWDVEAPVGQKDGFEISAHGSLATAHIKMLPDALGRTLIPKLMLTPSKPEFLAETRRALEQRCKLWQSRWPGIQSQESEGRLTIMIPTQYLTSHEAHFAQVLQQAIRHVRNPRWMPTNEWPNLLCKYSITTTSVKMAYARQQND
jgi:hypothetical protein